jgi:hypothetical protein
VPDESIWDEEASVPNGATWNGGVADEVVETLPAVAEETLPGGEAERPEPEPTEATVWDGPIPAFEGDLPPDIEMIWGDAPLARSLITAWGLERFRGSALHADARDEVEMRERKAKVSKEFLASIGRK